MTAVLVRPETPSPSEGLPGWDIVADMTPPELVNSRWIAVLRRRIAVALVLLVAACAAGYVLAGVQHRSAVEDADAAAARTTYLQRQADQYAGITSIEATVKSINGQVSTVMANDVSVAAILATIRRDLPESMAMQSISMTFTPEGSTAGAVGLDASGRAVIGNVTISGGGQSLDDLPAFVDGLSATKGFVDVLPTSNSVSKGVAQYSVTLTLTDALHTHRYDATKDLTP